MNGKPNVLIFDDEEDWAEQIAAPLHKKFNVITISQSEDWNKQIGSAYWDAIIIDVQILGDDLYGPDRAKLSILKYLVTAPIIVISGVVNLKIIQKKHGNIFFKYIHKDNCIKELPPLVESACLIEDRKKHIQRMTTEFAKKYGILDYEFPDDWIISKHIRETFANGNKKTIRRLISMTYGGTKIQLNEIGKTILIVITRAIDQRKK